MLCLKQHTRISWVKSDATTSPDSPLRFGAFALGQQADMWLRLATPEITPLSLRKLHISRTLGDIVKEGGMNYK